MESHIRDTAKRACWVLVVQLTLPAHQSRLSLRVTGRLGVGEGGVEGTQRSWQGGRVYS